VGFDEVDHLVVGQGPWTSRDSGIAIGEYVTAMLAQC